VTDSVRAEFPVLDAHKELSLLKNQVRERSKFCGGILPQRF
jgi:hypothetical protein